MPRKPPAPPASALSLFVSLETPTDQLTVWQGGLTQLEEENCARLGWVKGVYLPPPRLTVYGFRVLDTTFQLVAWHRSLGELEYQPLLSPVWLDLG